MHLNFNLISSYISALLIFLYPKNIIIQYFKSQNKKIKIGENYLKNCGFCGFLLVRWVL